MIKASSIIIAFAERKLKMSKSPYQYAGLSVLFFLASLCTWCIASDLTPEEPWIFVYSWAKFPAVAKHQCAVHGCRDVKELKWIPTCCGVNNCDCDVNSFIQNRKMKCAWKHATPEGNTVMWKLDTDVRLDLQGLVRLSSFVRGVPKVAMGKFKFHNIGGVNRTFLDGPAFALTTPPDDLEEARTDVLDDVAMGEKLADDYIVVDVGDLWCGSWQMHPYNRQESDGKLIYFRHGNCPQDVGQVHTIPSPVINIFNLGQARSCAKDDSVKMYKENDYPGERSIGHCINMVTIQLANHKGGLAEILTNVRLRKRLRGQSD